MKVSQQHKRNRHEFLLTFFKPDPVYQTKRIHGYVLVKYHSSENNQWEVAIYTPESFERAQQFVEKRKQWQRPNQAETIQQAVLPSK
jgi:hypothetical protein